MFIECSSLFEDPVLEEHPRQRLILLKFLATEENVYLHSLLHQVHINKLLIPLAVDGREHCLGDVREQRLEDHSLENLEALVGKGSQGIDFYVESVKILKEALHPTHHDSMIRPFLLQFLEQLFLI